MGTSSSKAVLPLKQVTRTATNSLTKIALSADCTRLVVVLCTGGHLINCNKSVVHFIIGASKKFGITQTRWLPKVEVVVDHRGLCLRPKTAVSTCCVREKTYFRSPALPFRSKPRIGCVRCIRLRHGDLLTPFEILAARIRRRCH
ncbi:hypothetical protein TcasGA2_TC014255 [Tribolium castaneum]|uniref:Uncharacterized protein n=1 Tax=Tribolium castaneum TaxID=7070 RepID=D6WKW1_TRICA|nr:hypothetical protein TcasGA2_TC014255 [Tribolium castaneum]